MTPFAAIFNVLRNDATILALLPGGLYDGLQVRDITRQATPAAFDDYAELKPCGILKPETQAPWGPLPDGSRLYVTLWLYAQSDMTALDAARERAYALLHRQQLTTVDHIFDVRHANDLLGGEVQTLDVPFVLSRFYATVRRV